ncbi:IS3 family transposase [uncultured Sphingomonas sp.]|uniref:IS3 family transposase n=1 Tax=uncultured Sphingomonas sp. TaxID=158754 RepID=UPI0035CB5454
MRAEAIRSLNPERGGEVASNRDSGDAHLGRLARTARGHQRHRAGRYQHHTHGQLETHLTDFIRAYNYARWLKTLRGLTPHEFICKAMADDSQRFTVNPHRQSLGPNT